MNEKKASLKEKLKWDALHNSGGGHSVKKSVKKPKKKVVKVSWWQKVKNFIVSLYPNLYKHMK